MAKFICKILRYGVSVGEHAPALIIKDVIFSPFGPQVFDYILDQLLTNVLAGKSQSQGLLLVAFSRNPAFYDEVLNNTSKDGESLHKWLDRVKVLDCYTDPLGWKDRLVESELIANMSSESSNMVKLCKNVRDLDNLFSSIIELGKELVGQGKGHFLVAIDSVSDMLRHSSLHSVAGLLANLRSHEKVSCVLGLLHSDLHESRASAVLEYMSTMLASVESISPPTIGQKGNTENYPLLEQNYNSGKLLVRIKHRNGKVRILHEDFCIEQSGIKFTASAASDGTIAQSLVPKVQFNLLLSEKERMERAKVVLPFEHQGHGKPIEIYDGRRSLTQNKTEIESAFPEKLETGGDHGSGGGEIIYFRDSDDEMPDSDEDPDDDLDI